MKKMIGFIGLVFLHLLVACSSMAPQPTAITDFKSVAGKWEGLLIRDHYFTQNFDRATLVVGDTGACESTIARTRTTGQGVSVSYSVIRVVAENGKLVLSDGKLILNGEKGGQATLQLHVDPGSGERILKANAKDSEGVSYSAELKRTGDAVSAK